MSGLVLHGYWRSGTSYRTRIALNIKQVEYRQVTHDLRQGEQKERDYVALNPQGLVPALETPQGTLTQSSAIIEWLDETYSEPSLFPGDAADRAAVRAMCMTVACDIHPLGNLRVLKYLKHELGQEQAAIDAWSINWISAGFDALEKLIERHGGRFAFGDTLTAADCHLVPQYYSAQRLKLDCSPWPLLVRSVENALARKPVAAAHPERQPDAD